MSGLIERIAETEVVILIPTGEFWDSKPRLAAVNARAFVIEQAENPVESPESFGTTKEGTILLVAPIEGAGSQPKLPGKVQVGKKTFEMASVKRLVNIQGVLVGYKIVVVGG